MQIGELFILGFFGKTLPAWLREFAERYGLGGVNCTVTDANVLLGRIQVDRFAGGKMRLDPKASASAIANSIGQTLNG